MCPCRVLQASKGQIMAYLSYRPCLQLAITMSTNHPYLLAKACQGAQERVSNPSGNQVVQSPQCAQDTLYSVLTLSVVLDDLKVAVRLSTFYPYKHVVPPSLDITYCSTTHLQCQYYQTEKISIIWHHILARQTQNRI